MRPLQALSLSVPSRVLAVPRPEDEHLDTVFLDVLRPPHRRIHDLLSSRRGVPVGELAVELVVPLEEVLADLAEMSLEGWVVQDDTGGWRRGPGPRR